MARPCASSSFSGSEVATLLPGRSRSTPCVSTTNSFGEIPQDHFRALIVAGPERHVPDRAPFDRVSRRRRTSPARCAGPRRSESASRLVLELAQRGGELLGRHPRGRLRAARLLDRRIDFDAVRGLAVDQGALAASLRETALTRGIVWRMMPFDERGAREERDGDARSASATDALLSPARRSRARLLARDRLAPAGGRA